MKIIVVFFGLSLLGWWMLLYTHLTVNETESLPYHVFFCVKGMPLKRGILVNVQGHSTCYTKTLSLTKRLVGLPGDHIEVKKGDIFVVGQSVGSLQSSTREGQLLTSLKARVIPEGYVFLSGDHLRSFDSRYEEFGLVKMRCLKARCFGLFKRRVS